MRWYYVAAVERYDEVAAAVLSGIVAAARLWGMMVPVHADGSGFFDTYVLLEGTNMSYSLVSSARYYVSEGNVCGLMLR